jgi:hypothetical protein
MNQREIDALEKCIAQTNAGVPIEECIKQIKDLTSEMIEILKTIRDLMSLGENQASDKMMKRSLSKLLSQAERLKRRKTKPTLNACQTPSECGSGISCKGKPH